MKKLHLSTYGRLLGYVRAYRQRIALAVMASLVVAGADVVYAKLVQPLIDRVLTPSGINLVNFVPVVVIGLAVIKGSGRYFQEYFIRTSGQLVIQEIRNQLFRHYARLTMGYYTRHTTGAHMSRLLNDVGAMQRAASNILVDVIREGSTFIGLVCLAFYQDWKLSLVAFVVLPMVFGPASLIGKKIKNYSRRGQGAMSTLTAVLEQAFSGIKVIKSFGTEESEIGKFRRENNNYYIFMRKLIKYNALSAPMMEIMAALGTAGVLWYGVHRVLSGAMTKGELLSISVAILMIYTPVKRLNKAYNTIQQSMGAAERVFEILDEEPDFQDRHDARVLPRVRGEIEFDRVSFAYQTEPILIDFSLRAAPGEVVALVGPSGAGKSTVAGLLNRFYDPQAGAIRIDGEDIREVTLDSLRQNIALVDQETFLFNETIAENIRYGRFQATDAEVREAARLAYAENFIEEMPDGFQTRIGDRGLRLSGGQRQRICIARAILRNAPILILDEATSALDTESEAMVQKALGNLMKNRTTLVIAHRLSTIMRADKIVVIESGRICQTGTHQELLDGGGLYRKLYEMQFQESA